MVQSLSIYIDELVTVKDQIKTRTLQPKISRTASQGHSKPNTDAEQHVKIPTCKESWNVRMIKLGISASISNQIYLTTDFNTLVTAQFPENIRESFVVPFQLSQWVLFCG